MTTNSATSGHSEPAATPARASITSRVGLAYSGSEIIKPAVRISRLSSLETLSIALGMVLLFILLIAPVPVPGIPRPATVNEAALLAVAAACMAFGILPLLIWSLRMPESHSANLHLLKEVRRTPFSDKPVWLIGLEEQLHRVLSLGPVDDSAFEPVVIRDWSPPPGAGLVIVLVVPGLALPLIRIASNFSNPGAELHIVILTVYVLILVWYLALPVLSPRYIRISPGVFETIKLSYLPWRKPKVVRCSLRSERIEIDLRQNAIWSMDASGVRTTIGFTSLRMRDRLAHHALLAAVSTAKVPDLPEDALVG